MSFYRAAWVLQILDCGFWTARGIQSKPLRDVMSIVYCLYFLMYPGKANEVHARYRRHFNIGIIRNSWEKGTHPLLAFVNSFNIPQVAHKQKIGISTAVGTIEAMLYFDGTSEELAIRRDVIFYIPGGGFVSMGPENYDDVISILAKRTRLPVLAVKYSKAPENPFPDALNECYEVYRLLLESNGGAIGMAGLETVRISGDSAGGNLACGVIIKAIQSGLKVPTKCALLCPLLTFEVQGWMSNERQDILKSTVPDYYPTKPSDGFLVNKELEKIQLSKIEVSSRFKYYNDMVLTPEFLLGMALMYLRKYPGAEPDKDPLLSPISAPDDVLQHFPQTFIQIGDKDPLVDDSLLFYSKLRRLNNEVELDMLEGVSHGYLNVLGLLPEARSAVERVCEHLW